MDEQGENINCTNISLHNSETFSPFKVTQTYLQWEVLEQYYPTSNAIRQIMIPFWIIVGLFGNILCFLVWFTPKIRKENSSAIYLIALSLSDSAFQLACSFEYVTDIAKLPFKNHPFTCKLSQAVYIFPQYYSIVLVLAFTVERFIAVCYPLKRGTLCTHRRAVTVVGFLALFVGVITLPHVIMWSYSFEEDICSANENIFIFLPEILISGCIPLCILCVNLRVVRKLSHVQQTRLSTGNNKKSMCGYHRGGGVPISNMSCSQTCKGVTIRHKVLPQSSPSGSSKDYESELDVDKQKCFSKVALSRHFSSRNSNRGERNLVRRSRSTSSCQNRETKQFRSTTIMLLTISFFMILCTFPTGVFFAIQSIFPVGNPCLRLDKLLLSPKWSRHLAFHCIKTFVDVFSLSHYSCNVILYLCTGRQFRNRTVHLLTCGVLKPDVIQERKRNELMCQISAHQYELGRQCTLRNGACNQPASPIISLTDSAL